MQLSSAPSSSSVSRTLGVLEFGTNSLKLHLYSKDLDRYEPVRAEWEVGLDIYVRGGFEEETIGAAMEHVEKLLERCQVQKIEDLFGIATGVFEEVPIDGFRERLHRQLGIPVRVLSRREQAQLLYLGFKDRVLERPSMVFDLGCGHLETVYLGKGQSPQTLCKSLPLGIIRIHHVASFGSGDWDEAQAERYIREHLRGANLFPVPSIHGTGGTVRAIARLAGKTELSRDVLKRVEDEVRQNGPPSFFSPRRQAIFLPGVVTMRRLLEHVGASVVRHHKVNLGTVLMGRILPLYHTMGSRLRDIFVDREVEILSW